MRQLTYLVALADSRHFGRAANASGVSQPTLSHQIKALEERLGVSLVERGDTPVRLSPIGREIAERARRVLIEVDDLKSLAQRSAKGIAGTIRFGVTPTLGPYLMPVVIGRLHRSHPEIRFHMREGFPDDQLAELRRGELDFMLMPLPAGGEDLTVEPLFREPLHLVAPPDHALCGMSEIATTDLRGARILSLDQRHPLHRQVASLCDDWGAEILRDYQGTSLDSLRQMAGSGIGMAILPDLYLRAEEWSEDIVTRLEVRDWEGHRSIAAIWRKGASLASSYKMIADVIAAEAHALLRTNVMPVR